MYIVFPSFLSVRGSVPPSPPGVQTSTSTVSCSASLCLPNTSVVWETNDGNIRIAAVFSSFLNHNDEWKNQNSLKSLQCLHILQSQYVVCKPRSTAVYWLVLGASWQWTNWSAAHLQVGQWSVASGTADRHTAGTRDQLCHFFHQKSSGPTGSVDDRSSRSFFPPVNLTAWPLFWLRTRWNDYLGTERFMFTATVYAPRLFLTIKAQKERRGWGGWGRCCSAHSLEKSQCLHIWVFSLSLVWLQS